MSGFGASSRVIDDPHVFENFDPATSRALTTLTTAQEDELFDVLYRDLALTRIRPTIEAPIEMTNDNGDPNTTDLSAFNFAWKRNDAHVDHVRRAVDRGVRTWFLSPVTLESFMDESNPAEAAEWAMVILRRWRDLGYELPYYSVVNEPGYVRGGFWSGAYLRDVIRLMGPMLDAEGLATRFVLPDDLNASQALTRSQIVLEDPVARAYVGAIAYHLYEVGEGGDPADRNRVKALADQYGKPIWMTEWFTPDPDGIEWAVTVHSMIADYGASAVDYLWGFFGEWEGDASMLVQLNYSGATYNGHTKTRRYYTFGQFSRFVTPGSVRLEATTTSGLRASAFADGEKIIVVVINDSTTAQSARLEIDGSSVRQFDRTRTSAAESWASLGRVEVGANIEFPARSVTTLVAGGTVAPRDGGVVDPSDGGLGPDDGGLASDDGGLAPDDGGLAPDDGGSDDAGPSTSFTGQRRSERGCGCRTHAAAHQATSGDDAASLVPFMSLVAVWMFRRRYRSAARA